MEMLEILDQDGQKLGIVKSNKSVHTDGDWHRAVHVWLIDPQGKLLIQRRSKMVANHPDKWDISTAGHVSQGEDSVTTALREAKEELGIELKKNQLQYLGSLTKQPVQNKGTYINNEHNDVYLVEMDLNIEELTLQKEEVSEVRLMPWKEFKSWVDEEREDIVPHSKEYSLLFDYLDKHYD